MVEIEKSRVSCRYEAAAVSNFDKAAPVDVPTSHACRHVDGPIATLVHRRMCKGDKGGVGRIGYQNRAQRKFARTSIGPERVGQCGIAAAEVERIDVKIDLAVLPFAIVGAQPD